MEPVQRIVMAEELTAQWPVIATADGTYAGAVIGYSVPAAALKADVREKAMEVPSDALITKRRPPA